MILTRRIIPAALVLIFAAFSLPVASASPRPPTITASPIQHVVVIYLENHSFDNVLGFWCQANPSRCDDAAGNFTGMPASVTLESGAVVTPSTAPDVVPVIGHSTIDQAAAIDGGKMDGWAGLQGCRKAAGYACISGYQPSQVPNAVSLATSFAISDETFSMQDSPSFFGHLYAVAASTDGFTGDNPTGGTGRGWGCDSGKVTSWAPSPGARLQTVPSCIPDPALGLPNGGAAAPTPVPYVPTILDRLNAAGLTWKLYGAQCTRETVASSGLETCGRTTNGALSYGWSICPSFAECLYSQSAGMFPDSQFLSDASAGTLPAFSVVTPANNANSEHNGFSMAQGDNWLGQLVSAVESSPDWSSTAVFITWDDCGCFYDQVAPGVNPDGTPQGPRVPLLIISPYARAGFTDTTPTTFAGILAYTEQNFGLAPLGVNDANAHDFSNAFNYAQAPLRPARMVTSPVPRGDRIDWAQARQDT